MPAKYKTYGDFSGGRNDVLDAKDLGPTEWAELQNVSVEKRGVARTVGALTNHSEVPAQTATICPGSGLKVYSSDHWREASPTIVDLLATSAATDSAVSDNYGEVDDTAGWTASGGDSLSSEADGVDGIASNGTSYVFKYTNATDSRIYASATTVIGQRYKVSADLYCGTTSKVSLVVGSTTFIGTSDDVGRTPPQSAAAWQTHSLEFKATATTMYIKIFAATSGTAYADKVYLTEASNSDLKGDWLALADVANAQVDLYSDNDDSFSAGSLDFGTVSTYVAAADGINFPTTSTITDAASQFLNKNMKRGQAWKISGCTSETANNILILLDRVTAGTLYVRGTPLTVAPDEDGTVTFTKYNPTSFHFVDEALRASPVNGGIALRPKHYGFVDRIQFYNDTSLAAESRYTNWYLNDVGPIAPTDQYVETTDADGNRDITSDLTAGAGFEIAITDNAAAGEWPVGTWEVASAFTYDDGQESALYIPSSAQTFTTTEASSQDIAVRGLNLVDSYDERISGARFYHRKTLSDDSWVLLADIDMKQGARATLSGNYNAWADGTTYAQGTVVYSDGFDSFRRNSDTYETLTLRDPSVALEDFATDGAGTATNNKFWDASVIAGNRCFLASARYTGAGGTTSYFRDRIIYSQVNQYDVFPITNYIDVIRGDADDYVRLIHFNGHILAFKQRNLFIVDISAPNPALWYLKDTYAFRGIEHAGAVCMTPHGPAWSNEHGCFLYDGSRVIDLRVNKISTTTWAAFHTDYSIDGYHPKTNTLIVMGDCTLDGSGDGYFFDFDQGAWTYASAVFDSTKLYTNLETDWSQDLIVGEESSGTVTIKKWAPEAATAAQNKFIITSKDDNMGSEFEKSLLAVIVHHKASAAQTDSFYYAINGSGTFVNTSLSSDNTLADTGDGDTEGWTRTVFTPSSPIYFYSLQWRIKNSTAAALMQINDVTLKFAEETDKIE